jgi:hypothetical protein
MLAPLEISAVFTLIKDKIHVKCVYCDWGFSLQHYPNCIDDYNNMTSIIAKIKEHIKKDHRRVNKYENIKRSG